MVKKEIELAAGIESNMIVGERLSERVSKLEDKFEALLKHLDLMTEEIDPPIRWRIKKEVTK